MAATLLTAPAVEPLSLDEARAFLRVEHGDDDEVIAALIAGARIHVETQCRRALITQSWRLTFDDWPADGRITVRSAPLRAVAAARIYDADSATAQAAVANAEAEWARTLAEVGRSQVREVGETMRAEAVSGNPLQRWWRPVYAFELTLIECPGFAGVLGHALWSGNVDAINGLASLSGLLMTYMAARFGVLGVYVTGRSREKQAAATGQAMPSIVGEVVRALANRR